MYKVLLAPGNTEFATAVVKKGLHFESTRLKTAIAAVATAQKVPSGPTLGALLVALNNWRTGEPNEYASRGQPQGIAWRLLMEVRQTLSNRFHQVPAAPPPPMPPGCPGTLLLGVYVPAASEGAMEICHGFAYRWRVAAGRMAESPLLPCLAAQYNADIVTPALYPLGAAGYPAARVGGASVLQPGDLISMWTIPGPMGGVPLLGHSLIAETATVWFSANNAGTFGVGIGRSQVDTALPQAMIAGYQPGWNGVGNHWKRITDGIDVQTVYLR